MCVDGDWYREAFSSTWPSDKSKIAEFRNLQLKSEIILTKKFNKRFLSIGYLYTI